MVHINIYMYRHTFGRFVSFRRRNELVMFRTRKWKIYSRSENNLIKKLVIKLIKRTVCENPPSPQHWIKINNIHE